MSLSLLVLIAFSLVLLAFGLFLTVDACIRLARAQWEESIRHAIRAAKSSLGVALGGFRNPQA